MTASHRMPFGAALNTDAGTAFRLWAPSATRVELELEGDGADGAAALHPMVRQADGWHHIELAQAGAGTRYRFVIDGQSRVPDPASRYNPQGVHGMSEVIDPQRYVWQDTAWRGRPWHEAVICEVHVGAFTAEGTFAAAARRLADLADSGFSAIELMPVAAFPGQRGWGYDGVLPFAPHAAYGTPDDLKALVDSAHGLGLMVLLDVVYNHFGPEGNYLHASCPEFFNPEHQTPWGAAINFDGPANGTVRDFFRHNALYWVEEFHFDGLRLDAVHAMLDASPRHIVCEIADALRDGPGRERHVHVVFENEANQASWLERGAQDLPLCATAQWNDDWHHAAHVLLSGEADGYYGDFAKAPQRDLARALAQGFVYQGHASPFRAGRAHGEPSAHLPAQAFVSFLQNHDQIGNRAFGERIDALADARRIAALYACLLLSPQIPMLFMGEEFAASTPFLFFCDFGPELAGAVAAGRRAEFARFEAFRDAAARLRIPDPNANATFEACKLRWHEREQPPHRERLALIRELLVLRQRHLLPRLGEQQRGGVAIADAGALCVEWTLRDASRWRLMANFDDGPVTINEAPAGLTIYSSSIERIDAQTLTLAPGAAWVVLQASPPAAGH